MVALLFVGGLAILLLGFFVYVRLVSRWLGVDDARPTPAHAIHDDPDAAQDPQIRYDYTPSRAPVLFGHHFSSIAGAGPIAGPIIAAAAFGWLPVFVWVVIGAVLIGGKRRPFAGHVTMDQVMVDVGDDPVALGDEVVFLGAQGGEVITADEWAGLLGTINYEIVCGFGPRLPRRYIG